MKKKSLLLISPVLVAGAISSCGGGFNKISTDDAIKIANSYDTRLSDVVMKDSNAKIHISKFGVKNGTGLFSYQKLDATDPTKPVGEVIGVDLNNLSFTAGEQDVVDILLPNVLLNDANNAVQKIATKKSANSLDFEETTFANIAYVLSATVSESMIRMYTGALKDLYGVTEWKHMKTNLYSKKSSNGNDILSAEVNIDSLTGLRDEIVAAKIPGADEVFNILGEGSVNIKLTCDDFGYISHLAITAKSDANKKLSYKTGKQAAQGGGSLPGIEDIKNLRVKPVGISFEGEVDIEGSIDITHNQAEEYAFGFQRTDYTYNDGKLSQGDTTTIADATKDSILDINPYAPIKVDMLRNSMKTSEDPTAGYIYGPVASAFEGNGYAVKINIKKGEKESDWVLGKDYMYFGYDGTESAPAPTPTTLEDKCKNLLYYYNVDKVGVNPTGKVWSDAAKPYPYASLIVNGVRVPTKTKETGSIIGSDYCYFTIETPKKDQVQDPDAIKATDMYLVLHVGKDVISKAKKTLGTTPKFTVDLKLQKLK